MNTSSLFIRRPIATSLLGIAILLGGILGYLNLPVAPLPQVDFPTIRVTTQLPGAIRIRWRRWLQHHWSGRSARSRRLPR